jgi:hypothetical protein
MSNFAQRVVTRLDTSQSKVIMFQATFIECGNRFMVLPLCVCRLVNNICSVGWGLTQSVAKA